MSPPTPSVFLKKEMPGSVAADGGPAPTLESWRATTEASEHADDDDGRRGAAVAASDEADGGSGRFGAK